MLRIKNVMNLIYRADRVYIKAKRNVSYSKGLNELWRHFQPHDASKCNERRRHSLNKRKCVAVASCLQVTSNISIPSYQFQIESFKPNLN
jgi:hypothetical protein